MGGDGVSRCACERPSVNNTARPWRPALDLAVLLAVALVCAGISNRLAGPTRRLAWLPEAPATSVIPPARAATPAAPLPARPAPPPQAEAPRAKIAPPKAAVPDWDPASLLARFPPLEGKVYAEVDGDDAHWLQLHGALILDARRSDVYAVGHLPGAQSLSVWEDGLQAKIANLAAAKADPLLPMVVYCAGGDCEDSHLLAQKLWLAGYRNLRVYSGGFPDWAARGWPIHRGAKP